MSVKISMIVAVAENGVIGNGEEMPWYLPSDFAHFKQVTMGKPVVMGRKTFESIGKPLPGRTNIVVSRQPGFQPEGVIVIDDLGAALDHARTIAEADSAGEVMVMGGGEIYSAVMPRTDRLYISHVALSPEGDVKFPEIASDQWDCVEMPPISPSDRDSAPYKICIYERRPAPSID